MRWTLFLFEKDRVSQILRDMVVVVVVVVFVRDKRVGGKKSKGRTEEI